MAVAVRLSAAGDGAAAVEGLVEAETTLVVGVLAGLVGEALGAGERVEAGESRVQGSGIRILRTFA